MQAHLLLGSAATQEDGDRDAWPHSASMTIISGPDGFNKHCEGLVRRLVPPGHPVVVLDA